MSAPEEAASADDGNEIVVPVYRPRPLIEWGPARHRMHALPEQDDADDT